MKDPPHPLKNHAAGTLQDLVGIWNPKYRLALCGLMLLGVAGSVLVYAENSLLQAIVQALSGKSSAAAWISNPAILPFILLTGTFCVGVFRAWLNARCYISSSRLTISGRNDLEKAILADLLRRDDGFYAQHSTGEIINRLELDVHRILSRRESLAHAWWLALSIAGNLVFFAANDLLLGVVVLAVCAAGTIYTRHVSTPVKAADNGYYLSNDAVKAEFEDCLKASPEIQAGDLHEGVIGRFGAPQERRLRAYMTWVLAYARVEFSRSAWPAAAFLASTLVVLSIGGESPTDRLSLIPVLIYALPSIFLNATTLVTLGINFQIAGNSVHRILEYQAGGNDCVQPSCEPGDDGPGVELVDAGFQYRIGDGEAHGGVSGVTERFSSGSWTAVCGETGTGKSTVINLALGRLRPQEGSVRITAPAGWDPAKSPLSLMPQKYVLTDSTILENLFLGSPSGATPGTDDMDLLEKTGVGDICRLKALEMRPRSAITDQAEVGEIRRRARPLASDLGITLLPYEGPLADMTLPLYDAVTGGRSDQLPAVQSLLAGRRPRWLTGLARSGAGAIIAKQGAAVIERTRNMLRADDYESYLQLSPGHIDQSV
ncbi:MAG: ABC transporter ATP-binding protein, partial [Myxococcota bacterium]